MEFWLTDGEDPALRNPKQDRPLPALPYEPPTDDLLEAMQVSPAQDFLACDTQKAQVTRVLQNCLMLHRGIVPQAFWDCFGTTLLSASQLGDEFADKALTGL